MLSFYLTKFRFLFQTALRKLSYYFFPHCFIQINKETYLFITWAIVQTIKQTKKTYPYNIYEVIPLFFLHQEDPAILFPKPDLLIQRNAFSLTNKKLLPVLQKDKTVILHSDFLLFIDQTPLILNQNKHPVFITNRTLLLDLDYLIDFSIISRDNKRNFIATSNFQILYSIVKLGKDLPYIPFSS